MPSAKEIKIYAAKNNLSNAEARKILLAEEINEGTMRSSQQESAEIIAQEELSSNPTNPTNPDQNPNQDPDRQLRELARNAETIALGIVLEKRGSGKPAKGLPKLTKKSAIFRMDTSLSEIEHLATIASQIMPDFGPDDFAYILGDGMGNGAHQQNGEQFAAALCGYFIHTLGYQHMQGKSDDPAYKGVIIRLIPYKDGYVLRAADYIRSYDQVDQSFAKMKLQ